VSLQDYIEEINDLKKQRTAAAIQIKELKAELIKQRISADIQGEVKQEFLVEMNLILVWNKYIKTFYSRKYWENREKEMIAKELIHNH